MASGQGPGFPRQECGELALPSASEEQVTRDMEKVFDRHQQEQEAEGSTVGQVGRQITMLQHLQRTAENAYEYFTKIASSLFESGINQGRVVALLGFSYHLVLHVYQRGLTGFLGQVTRFVVFMLQHCIAWWIAQRGSWVAALDLGNGPILNMLVILGVVLLGPFVVQRFFKS
uniref:Bcl-2 Bcl-2 homology region 1-3 domain-containing protein n=1 Tax=Cercocebus atys TaxID=9531 RepID=A0A2K5KTQ1_CERAT